MTIIEGRTGPWHITVGIETHAQIASAAKLFSSAPTDFGGEPNMHVTLVDAAMPGMLPVLNQECVRLSVLTALGLNAEINEVSVFDRKHYFYPDLPQGYQISQFTHPIASNGSVRLDLEDGEKWVRVERLHIEQDAGKSIHDAYPNFSLVDLNRSGVGLMEIVSAPDINSAIEAKAYLTKIRAIVRCLKTCDGNMEQGSMRADINVSVARPGEPLGTRCEIKNVNSIRFAGQAINYEARRQVDLIEDGQQVQQQTRLFDPRQGVTRSMRSKEEAHDYRYFPCPDLPHVHVSKQELERWTASMPELPDARRDRFIKQYGVTQTDAAILASDTDTANEFESLATNRQGKVAAKWMLGEVFALRNRLGDEAAKQALPMERLGELVDMIGRGDISGRQGKEVFEIMIETGQPCADIVQERGLAQQSDESELASAIDALIADNPEQAEQVKQKPKALGWFVGQIMAKTKGSANPQVVNRLLREKLGL